VRLDPVCQQIRNVPIIEFYAQIRWVHVAAVIVSGSLFALRGAGVLAGGRWPMWAPLRYLTYTVDTVLLTAALMLATLLHQYPFVHAWLTVKVLLLVLYIVLGTLALKRAPTRSGRAWCYAAALAVFLFIVSVARAHSPLGFLGYFTHG
jgi:uncharacterized membrane protein SirB2